MDEYVRSCPCSDPHGRGGTSLPTRSGRLSWPVLFPVGPGGQVRRGVKLSGLRRKVVLRQQVGLCCLLKPELTHLEKHHEDTVLWY